VRELHGFEKVYLKVGEERIVKVTIDEYATSFWDESEEMWCSEEGRYKVCVRGTGMEVRGELVMGETRRWVGL